MMQKIEVQNCLTSLSLFRFYLLSVNETVLHRTVLNANCVPRTTTFFSSSDPIKMIH